LTATDAMVERALPVLGEAIRSRTPRPDHGRVVVSHLGVGLADLVFGDAILRRAEAAGLGTILPA
jgi:ornithine cyclodeaminase/alanine dehydrogenase-like protein (mu-crystallin family)